jgi:hypothetical protein
MFTTRVIPEKCATYAPVVHTLIGLRKVSKMPLYIPLGTKRHKYFGQFTALIDYKDYDLTFHKWSPIISPSGVVYAQRTISDRGRQIIVSLHRAVMSHMEDRPILSTEIVDHVDSDGLNCQRSNLRIVTPLESSWNTRGRGQSGYKGVHYVPRDDTWRAYITVRGKLIYLGTSRNARMLAKRYDAAAVQHYGRFAKLNFPEDYPDLMK